MIKKYCLRIILFILSIFQSSLIFAQTTIGMYQFAGHTCTSPMYSVTTQPAHATFSDLISNQTCHYFINRYLASNWSQDNTGPGTTYVEFSLTADSTTNLIISQVKYTRKRTETGPAAMILKYSTDGVNFQNYSTSVDSVGLAELRRSLTRQVITEKGATVTFRLYGWLAADSEGMLYLDDIEVLGAVLSGPVTFYTQGSGNSNASIWGTSPSSTITMPAVYNSDNSFVVQAGHTVFVSSTITAKNLTIQNTGKIYAGSDVENTVHLYGNLVVNGSFGNGPISSDKLSLKTYSPSSSISGSGTFHTYNLQNVDTLSINLPSYIQGNITSSKPINFNNKPVTLRSPSGTQTISGSPLTVKDLTIYNNGTGVFNQTSVTINGVLTLSLGTFYTSDKVLLDLNSGYISRSGTGALSGKIKLRKKVAGNEYGYHHVAFPLTDVPLSELADNATLEKGGYSWIYSYNEADTHPSPDSGWVAVSGLSTPLPITTGYSFYFNKPTTLDFSGYYSHALTPLKFNITNTNSGDPQSDGWNLIGNPFPSPIDWTLDSGWVKTNMNNAVYVWDPKADRYRTYINGASLNGGSPIIPSMQAFFVKASTGLWPLLTVNKRAYTTAANPAVIRTAATPAGLKIAIANINGSDETLIRLTPEADTTFDDAFDAYKLLNSGPSIYTQLNGISYAVNSIPKEVDSIKIPLVISAPAGNYLISASDLSAIGAEYNITLTDNQFSKTLNLRTNPNYSVYINQNESPERFYLMLSKADSDVVTGVHGTTSQQLNLYCFDKKLFINHPESATNVLSLSISDISGNQVIRNKEVAVNGADPIYHVDHLKPGLYIVSIFDGQTLVSQKILIY